jgi:tRNA-Thr(GGU) m(6)t(6)A37 methyltransferase TsaA
VIRLNGGANYEQALEELRGFGRIWIISWFHRVEGWKPKVLPPRSVTKKGVFATRSPHRPNPIGLSLCRLVSIRGRTIRVADPDLLDGTPILDLKPYLSYAEAFPGSACGWVDEVASCPRYQVEADALAVEQEAWLRARRQSSLLESARSVLSEHPHPHAYRRTRRHPHGGFVLAMKAWRIRYTTEGERVIIHAIESGYAPSVIRGKGRGSKEVVLHRAFVARWSPQAL